MSNIIYRSATLKDLPFLLKFEQELIAFERPFDSNLNDNISYYDIKAMIESEVAEVLVAEKENQVIASGYAKIVEAKPYHKNPKYAYLGFMYVKPEYRGQGIIQIIIEELKSWSKMKNIFEARLEVYNDNPNAIKAYENKGFKKHMIEMKLYFNK